MKGSDRREQSFDTAESETLGMWGSSMRENPEALQAPTLPSSVGRSKKAKGRNVDMHVRREAVDQGERTTSALVPDTEPGKRVTGVVARKESGNRADGRHMNPR